VRISAVDVALDKDPGDRFNGMLRGVIATDLSHVAMYRKYDVFSLESAKYASRSRHKSPARPPLFAVPSL